MRNMSINQNLSFQLLTSIHDMVDHVLQMAKVIKMIGDAYESKNAENGKGFETKRDLSDDRLRGDILSGETESICPVVKNFERRKKKDNDRGSAGMGGTYIRQGG